MIQTRTTINNNPRAAPATRELITQLRRGAAQAGPIDRFLAVERPGQKFGGLRAPDWDFVAAPSARLQRPVDLYQLAAALQAQSQSAFGHKLNGGPSFFKTSASNGLLEEGGVEDPVKQARLDAERESSNNLRDGEKEKEARDSETTEMDASEEDRPVYEALPFFARWFAFGRVHSLERDALAEFFGEKPSKTPQVYVKLRDFIVRLYFADPTAYLTPTACRRSIAGDAGSVLRVHAFLETWGVINFGAAGGRGHKAALVNDAGNFPSFVAQLESSSDKHNSNNNNNSNFNSGNANVNGTNNGNGNGSGGAGGALGPAAGSAGRLFEQAFERHHMTRPKCFQCQVPVGVSWRVKRDFSVVNGQEATNAQSIALCEDCFDQERFPVFFGKEDFEQRSLLESKTVNGLQKNGHHEKNGASEQLEQNEEEQKDKRTNISKPFTLEEQIKLIEIVQADEKTLNWKQITEQFPSRIEEEVVQAFLHLPLHKQISNLPESLAVRKTNEELGASVIEERFEQALANVREMLGDKEETLAVEEVAAESRPAFTISRRVNEIFEKKLEKVTLKLRFFEEVEKSLYHEQQAAKLL